MHSASFQFLAVFLVAACYDYSVICTYNVEAAAQYRELVLLAVGRHERTGVEQELLVFLVLLPLLSRYARSCPCTDVSEHTLLVFVLQFHIHHCLFLVILDAGEFCRLGLLVHHFHLVHNGCRQVVKRCGLVAQEERLSVQSDL